MNENAENTDIIFLILINTPSILSLFVLNLSQFLELYKTQLLRT
jgi:hypothetical protein